MGLFNNLSKATSTNKILVSYKFFQNTIDKLNKLAELKGITKTKLIENLIYKEYENLF